MPTKTRKKTIALLTMVPAAAVMLGLNLGGAQAGSSASAKLKNVDGRTVGAVQLVATERSHMTVTATVRLPGDAAGFHGFHIHTTGVCDPTAVNPANGAVSPFFSAGGHLGSVEGQSHDDHAGDMPSLLVNADGTATAMFRTDRATLTKIFDNDGAAIIVHQDADNFANIPSRYTSSESGQPGPDASTLKTGDAGARQLCGVLR
jgi:Cu-Zn family superoxide dismutase